MNASIAALLISLILLAQGALGQSVEDGWKGIRPIVATKSEVQKAFGKPSVIDDNNYYGYRTEDAFIQVNYSTEPCKENRYGRGKFKIAIDTVLSYDVHFRKAVKLSDLNFDRSKYGKDTSGDLINSWTYFKVGGGLSITVGVMDDKNMEYVSTIHYGPSHAQAEKLECAEIK